jgi:hypothetical protein
MTQDIRFCGRRETDEGEASRRRFDRIFGSKANDNNVPDDAMMTQFTWNMCTYILYQVLTALLKHK